MPQAQESSQPVTLPPIPQLSDEQVNLRSLTHWVVMLGNNISNMMPWGLKSDLGYLTVNWTAFERCVPYPLGNRVSTSVDRQAMAEIHASGFSLSSTETVTKDSVKYALEQAQELGESYGDQGLRVLTPLTGIDDIDKVKRIFAVVQPLAYPLHEMEWEFTVGAAERIDTSKLSPEEKDLATRIAAILLNGARKAIDTANLKYEELIDMMSDAQIGKPGISNPNRYHHWLCGQLGKAVPERINRMQQSTGDSAAIKILADRALREETAYEALSEKLAARDAMIERLEKRLSDLEKPKAKSA